MDMKLLRYLPVALLLALVAVAAGCGGGSKGVPSSAVARVGSDTVTKGQFNSLMLVAQHAYKARKTPFPKAGTTQFKTLQDQAMQYLVQQTELEQKAKDLNVKVTDKDVATRLVQLKKQCCAGSQATYEKQLKAQGLTEPELKQDLHAQVLSEKLYTAVTGKLKVTDAEITKYYNTNKAQYGTPETRDVRHILVSSKKTADSIESQLKSGASFAALAKKFSKDPGSAKTGGKLTISKGQTVPPFDKAAFSLKTNELSAPVHSQYGWHIIQALSPVRPPKSTPLASVKAQIGQQLLQKKKTDVMTKWLADVKKSFATKISYQVGYAPASVASTTSTTSTPATTTN
jgi:parvulin-like peptidyl-prolyl isomerase